MDGPSLFADHSMTIQKTSFDQDFTVGDWRACPVTGELTHGRQRRRLEPMVMRLLCLLAARAPEVVSRSELHDALWPDTVVGEDALARCLLKLRRALGDDARRPRYIETLPRRGYRLVAPAEPVRTGEAARSGNEVPRPSARHPFGLPAAVAASIFALAALLAIVLPGIGEDDEAPLLARAHDHYYRFTQADNERAQLLYQRVLDAAPDRFEARAGLANTLSQRVIRWPEVGDPVTEDDRSVAKALASDRLDSPWARATLARARTLAEDAAGGAPTLGFAWKALGLVATLQRDLDAARSSYGKALAVDPTNWEAAMNLGELELIAGDERSAVEQFVRAYRIMEERYAEGAPGVGSWQPEVGVLIGETYREIGERTDAEAWFRRVLETTPLHEIGRAHV